MTTLKTLTSTLVVLVLVAVSNASAQLKTSIAAGTQAVPLIDSLN